MVRHIKILIFSTDLSAKLPLKNKYKVRKNRTSLNELQVLSGAPNSRNPNLVPIGEGFGFLLYLDYPNFNNKIR